MNEIITTIVNSIYKYLLSEDTQKENGKAFIEEINNLLAKRDTSDVWRQFAIWMLVDPDHGAITFTKIGSIQRDAIRRVAELFIEDCKDEDQWKAAASATGTAQVTPGSSTNHAVTVAKEAALYSIYDRPLLAHDAALYAFIFYTRLVPNQVSFFYSGLDFYGVDWAAHIKRMADRLIHLMRVAPRLSTTI